MRGMPKENRNSPSPVFPMPLRVPCGNRRSSESMTAIRSLKPNVTREQAILQFSAKGIPKFFRNAAFGHLRSVAELYIPFRLFQAQISNRGKTEQFLVALDGVSGTLDLFQFDHLPIEAETIRVETRNHLSGNLDSSATDSQLMAKLRRIAYGRGFFRLQGLEIHATPVDEIHIPYWLGFRGSDDRARVAVIDAVRRRFEGAKVRRMVESWLISKR